MADHIVEQLFQIFDPVRDAGDVGMNRDRHHPGIVGALEVEPVELVGAAAQELIGCQMLQRVDNDVVGLHRIGNGRNGSVRGLDILRKIIDDPVCDILDPVQAEEIKGLAGLGQPGTLPRSWELAGEFRDCVDRAFDRISLILQLVHRTL